MTHGDLCLFANHVKAENRGIVPVPRRSTSSHSEGRTMKERQKRFVTGAIIGSVLLVVFLVTAAELFGGEADKILEGPLAAAVVSVAELQGLAVATDLVAEAECSGTETRKAIAKLSWKVAKSPGSEQRVAITIFRDGFEKGTFEST